MRTVQDIKFHKLITEIKSETRKNVFPLNLFLLTLNELHSNNNKKTTEKKRFFFIVWWGWGGTHQASYIAKERKYSMKLLKALSTLLSQLNSIFFMLRRGFSSHYSAYVFSWWWFLLFFFLLCYYFLYIKWRSNNRKHDTIRYNLNWN